jgi:hypothetical protein
MPRAGCARPPRHRLEPGTDPRTGCAPGAGAILPRGECVRTPGACDRAPAAGGERFTGAIHPRSDPGRQRQMGRDAAAPPGQSPAQHRPWRAAGNEQGAGRIHPAVRTGAKPAGIPAGAGGSQAVPRRRGTVRGEVRPGAAAGIASARGSSLPGAQSRRRPLPVPGRRSGTREPSMAEDERRRPGARALGRRPENGRHTDRPPWRAGRGTGPPGRPRRARAGAGTGAPSPGLR